MSNPHDLVRATELIDGQFRLVRPLGRGGMGSVWVAEDQRLGRSVAIKFLSRDLSHDPQARMRFEREPRLASMIRSPHVVQIYSHGSTAEGLPYLVMELLDGEDLASRLARGGRCALEDACQIVTQVASALTRAHQVGLIHRDIKPHNIFLTRDDERDFVKVLDFGVAKKLDTHAAALTQSGAVLGSLPYMSPEQLDSSPAIGPATDVWALGVVAYEMLTGEQPFPSTSLPELFAHILAGRFTPLSALAVELPHAFEQFFAKALAVDPSQRFASVAELDRALVSLVRANTSGLSLKAAPAPDSRASSPEQLVDERSQSRRWWWIALLAIGVLAWVSYALRHAPLRESSVNAALSAPAKPATESSRATAPVTKPALPAAGSAPDVPAVVAPPAPAPLAPPPTAAAPRAQDKPARAPARTSSKPSRPNYGF